LKVLERLNAAGGLEQLAKLDTIAIIVDCLTLFNDFETSDLLSL
jgi:hypothetical protein